MSVSFLTAALLLVAAQAQPATTTPAAPVDPDKKICKTIKETGSRLGGKRECRTQAECGPNRGGTVEKSPGQHGPLGRRSLTFSVMLGLGAPFAIDLARPVKR